MRKGDGLFFLRYNPENGKWWKGREEREKEKGFCTTTPISLYNKTSILLNNKTIFEKKKNNNNNLSFFKEEKQMLGH